MKSKSRKLVWLAAVGVVVLAVAGVTGCQSSSGSRTSGQKSHDREIARAVKKNLSADPTFKYTDVQANVYDGNIQLTGFVETPEQRLRAAERVAPIRGTKQVINEIMIKPMPTGPATIRDPLGHETGRMLVDTNSPVPQMRNLPASETAPQQTGGK